jgi:hypothetical protein
LKWIKSKKFNILPYRIQVPLTRRTDEKKSLNQNTLFFSDSGGPTPLKEADFNAFSLTTHPPWSSIPRHHFAGLFGNSIPPEKAGNY